MQPQLRKHRSDSQAAADQHDLVALFQMGGHAQRTDKIEDGRSLGQGHHLMCCFPDCLNDNGHRAFFTIEIRDRQRNAFACFVDSHHDEMTGLAGLRHFEAPQLPTRK